MGYLFFFVYLIISNQNLKKKNIKGNEFLILFYLEITVFGEEIKC